jgi:hypothetical protein
MFPARVTQVTDMPETAACINPISVEPLGETRVTDRLLEEVMQVVDQTNIETDTARPILNVTEFCRRHRLDKFEEARLRRLFGDFASRHELLMNAQRPSLLR